MPGGITPPRIYAIGFLLPFTLLIAAVLLSSHGWRFEHDTPLLHYAAFMINEYGWTAYRDIFETSMPGTLAFHVLLTRTFGYSDLAFRLVDIASVLLVVYLSMRLCRRWGLLVGLSTGVIYAALYLGYGQSMSLQRDYLGLILILACLNLCTAGNADRNSILVIGTLLSCAALIKPHLVIGAPVILWLYWHNNQPERGQTWLGHLAIFVAGGLLPAIAILIWLGPAGAMNELWALLWHYLPLYNQINGDLEIISGQQASAYFWAQLIKAGGFQAWLLAALAGYLLLWRQGGEDRIWAIALSLLTALYLAYAAIAGKFWAYHFMPFLFFCVLGSCLLLRSVATAGWQWKTVLPPIIVVLLVLNTINGIQLYPRFVAAQFSSEDSIFPPKAGRVDRIKKHLLPHVKPGDRAQALDTTGGAIHALLDLKIPHASPFIYDYHFYHHVDNPYIQTLQSQFLDAMTSRPPRFIVEITARNKPYVSGETTMQQWPALESLIAQQYTELVRESDFRIYELKEQG